jgi:hypothetical protein
MEVIIVFLHLLQSYRFHKIENETIHKTFPDGTSEKVAIDANTNIPSDSRVFRAV